MAIDNLNYYSAGLPAGQQTDRYSSQPGCLRSKNLDIFSSSKSVKATAWSNATTGDADVIKAEGGLVLKTDGKIYERNNGVDTLLINPNTDMPRYQVDYTGTRESYYNAIWGTPMDMSVKSEGDERKSFVAYTDRTSLVYSKTKYVAGKTFLTYGFNMGSTLYSQGYAFTKESTTSAGTCYIRIKIENPGIIGSIPIRLYANETSSPASHISLESVKQQYERFSYDAELDQMVPGGTTYEKVIPFSGDLLTSPGMIVNVPVSPIETYDSSYEIEFTFKFTPVSGSSPDRSNCTLYIDVNGGPRENHYMKLLDNTRSDGDYNYYYSYLPLRERKLTDIGEYYWMKGSTFQTLYTWQGSWVNVNGLKKIRYDFIQYMGWNNDVSMDVIGMVAWNEQVYMIGNMNGNGYIIPCDLSGGVGTPYIAYGCEFLGATNIDYLMYLVGKDRGISQLWVYNGQEMVAILGGTEENGTKNLIDNAEQYKFDGKMVEYRDDLILSTTDNRIFAYGQTFGGKGGAFIHELPGTIKELKADGNDLSVKYTVSSTDYVTTLQDDTPIKNYNTEWMAEYPIVLGNHLLEKEESDLYASYIIPSSACKLEFWGMANHYHFWTFTSSDSYTFSTEASYKMKGCTGNYALKFIEKNDNQYTFRLEGDLPIQTTNNMKITDTEGTELITYSEYNHFRKIGEITTTEYQEGEFRFHNLNNKLELPKSHSLQIMVKGKGIANYTPELFALDLVANQRDRG